MAANVTASMLTTRNSAITLAKRSRSERLLNRSNNYRPDSCKTICACRWPLLAASSGESGSIETSRRFSSSSCSSRDYGGCEHAAIASIRVLLSFPMITTDLDQSMGQTSIAKGSVLIFGYTHRDLCWGQFCLFCTQQTSSN